MKGTEDISPAARPLSVGVLVLNYNTWDLALRALNAALELEAGNVAEFVLFDDGSPTPAPAGIDPRIRLERGDHNLGFARALGVAFSRMKSDIIVLFDSDAYPLTSFAESVRRRFEAEPGLGQLGFRSEREDGTATESCFAEPTQWSLILGQALASRLPHRAVHSKNLCVITGCMATRMEAYRAIGGFDPELGFLDVDVDYSMRLRRHGWSVAVDSSLRAFHVGGGTAQTQRNRVLQFYKSRWYLLRKHGLMWSPGAARSAILARLYCEKLLLSVIGGRIFPDPEMLEDKLLGRQALLLFCRSDMN